MASPPPIAVVVKLLLLLLSIASFCSSSSNHHSLLHQSRPDQQHTNPNPNPNPNLDPIQRHSSHQHGGNLMTGPPRSAALKPMCVERGGGGGGERGKVDNDRKVTAATPPPRSSAPNHAHGRICPRNDTLCGHWRGRFWHPIACQYADVTPEQARKCIGNRTIAFIGDSQIRDTMLGVVNLLMGMELNEAPDAKVDKYHNFRIQNSTIIGSFARWKHNSDSYNLNGNLFPQKHVAKEKGYNWQIQMWGLFRNEFTDNNQAADVLNNQMSQFNQSTLGLRNIDFAFWSHGLHDYGWWEKQPYGKNYFDSIVNRWIKIRKSVAVPSVWVSMNNNCIDKLKFQFKDKKTQFDMIEDANSYINSKMLQDKLPYWDAAAVLRTPSRCAQSDDGIHVKMWVDLMRAKMLFNHLCDSQFNWMGSTDKFVN